MQQVVKVSIGNIAFTLDKDAHGLMEDYLDSLKSHYRGSANCGEILSEIESRIAELLTDRGYRDKVVPAEAVQESSATRTIKYWEAYAEASEPIFP